MKTTTLILAVFATSLTLGGCAYWNEEAGAFLDQGEFGNATLNNQLAHTCRKLNASNIQKYGQPIASGCPGRIQDGKYAMFAYRETIESATELSGENIEDRAVDLTE